MVPSTLLQVVLLIALFAPGYVWVRVAEVRRPRPERSGLFETSEFAVVGVCASAAALGVAILISSFFPQVFAEPEAWASSGWEYARQHLVEAASSTVLVLAIALGGTWALARFLHRNLPPLYGPERTVWSDVLGRSGTRVDDMHSEVAFLAAHMIDGRIVEGFLRSFPSSTSSPVEDVALQAPIFIRKNEGSPRTKIESTDYLILRLSQVADVSVRFEERRVPTP
jgi:hypothetical protein